MLLTTLAASIASSVELGLAPGYLDPGTGSYALQLLLAGVFGGLFALKQSWHQVRTRFAQFRSPRRTGAASLETAD